MIQNRGMSLLEVLVSISLMVIISAISYTSLNSLVESKQHTDEVAEKLKNEVILSRQLNYDFESIIDRQTKGFRGELNPSIQGDIRSVSLIRNGNINPLNEFRSELQKVQWLFSDGQVIRRNTKHIETQQSQVWNQKIMLSGIKDFRVEYVSRINGSKKFTWPSDNENGLPRSINIKIEFEDGRKAEYYLKPNRQF